MELRYKLHAKIINDLFRKQPQASTGMATRKSLSKLRAQQQQALESGQ
jgi:hypothetical protein